MNRKKIRAKIIALNILDVILLAFAILGAWILFNPVGGTFVVLLLLVARYFI